MKTKSFLPTLYNNAAIVHGTFKHAEQELKTSPAKSLNLSCRGSSDDIPLLIKVDNATELREIKLDYISTITS